MQVKQQVLELQDNLGPLVDGSSQDDVVGNLNILVVKTQYKLKNPVERVTMVKFSRFRNDPGRLLDQLLHMEKIYNLILED